MLGTGGSGNEDWTLLPFRNSSSWGGEDRLTPYMRILENEEVLYVSYRWKELNEFCRLISSICETCMGGKA